MYSLTSTIWPGAARTSCRKRSKRLRRVFRSATRIVSSYDIHSARCRATAAVSAKPRVNAPGLAIPSQHLAQAAQIEFRVGAVLIIHQPAYPLDDDPVQMGRKGRAHLGIEPPAGIALRLGPRRDDSGDRSALQRQFESGGESGEIRVHGDRAGANRLLVRIARKRQRARGGERAEQHGTDEAAGFARGGLHVEAHEAARCAAQRREHRVRLGDSIAERRFFGNAVDAVGRGHQRGSIRGDESAHHRAPRLHELGADHHVDVAGHGHEREDRLLCRVGGPRTHLEVVHRRPGALRHSGHRGGLHQPTGALRDRDDPVGEHAAALPAEGGDGDGQRPLRPRSRLRSRRQYS